ncbi:hypothetical protein OKA04_15245 [Luteolibacter flavescens]|uniref:C2H2-type domain-containing protein n=1 Tax=Luteolibacter flavescens TaxID=1859460 RepID=A0ABT3FR91_9BACT|nr:hypothetical protein [Luteolibacter flavescens]MCW1886093.1 hypothetical protein [Luteolibacter flavescens]
MNATVRQLCCQGCGATLPVTEGIRFLTCNYCSARLEIVEDHATTHTRLIEGIERRTKKIERDVEVLRLHADLKRLDEAWARYEARVDPRDERGRQVPNGLLGIGLVGVVVSLSVLISEAWWLGLLIASVAVWFVIHGFRSEMDKGRIIHGMKTEYERRRKMLIQQINGGA